MNRRFHCLESRVDWTAFYGRLEDFHRLPDAALGWEKVTL